MDKEKVLKQLRDNYHDYNHILGIIEEKDIDGFENWEKAGKPYMWVIVQESKNKILLVDASRGNLALVINNELHDTGKDFVISSDESIIGISEYYGVEKSKLYKAL